MATLLVASFAGVPANGQAGRDYVYVVGSSTVYPFSTVVAERVGRGSRYRTPKVESTGSGGGMKLFCAGIGIEHPDVVNASRRITRSEMASCQQNGVSEIVEVRIGYDGIVLANAIDSPRLDVSRRELFLALAARVPGNAPGELIENPFLRWNDIDSSLPDLPIEVLGPPPTSGTRDAFAALVLEHGCREWPWIEALAATDPEAFRRICQRMREDGRYVEAGENDNLVVQKLKANRSSFGILGFSFVDQNTETLKGARIDGVDATFDNIGTLAYPVSRPLYFYVKKAHVPVIPGLRDFLEEFVSERAWGDDGYLSYRGLVPLPPEERAEVARRVADLGVLSLASRRLR